MIVADTSVWIDHLRSPDGDLIRLLEDQQVLGHPFVLGELALGNLRQRRRVLIELARLPQAVVASEPEILHFIEEEALHGRGIGYVDVHLLASLRLMPGTRLWTRDTRLHAVAEGLGLAAPWSK